MEVSVSILKEYENLDYAVEKVNDSIADFLHVDVMDGIFVENKKFDTQMVKDVISKSKKKVDLHLMVQDIKLIKDYIDLKPYYATFHVEVIKDDSLIKYAKEKNVKVGLAINPETDVNVLMPYIDLVDLVLIMSVHPGLGGQKFIKDTLSKVITLKKLKKNIVINIDGGVNDETAILCKNAGCTMLVSGSYITDSDNYDEKIALLKQKES